MAERYVHLNENLYFDTKDKAIVKNMGNRYVFVRHDRRTKISEDKKERRKEDIAHKDMIKISNGLFFDKKIKQLYKLTGGKLVLYSINRRKSTKPVEKDRRKKVRLFYSL